MPGSFLSFNQCSRRVGAFVMLLLLATSGYAQFPIDPTKNLAISTATDGQSNPAMVSDGAGGAIIAWEDLRSGQGKDIYAQHINASGVVQWDTNGIVICAESGIQDMVVMIPDGTGGAILAWEDKRSDVDYDIYAQRISASGTAMWSAGGLAIASGDGDQQAPAIVSDGQGGAIIVWNDTRSGSSSNIYAQRINASGSPLWAANGVPVLKAQIVSQLVRPALVSDGNHGAIVGWDDARDLSTQPDIYVQRVDAAGTCRWDTAGFAACKDSSDQHGTTLVSDGSGGVIACWTDTRTQTRTGVFGDIGVYAQRVDSSGAAKWARNGIAVNDTIDSQQNPAIVGDGSGGAIVSWEDHRNGGDLDVYVQRIDGSGTLRWASGGVPVCVLYGDQYLIHIVGDSSGGAIIAWTDSRSGDYDIYAQAVTGSGAVRWTTNGVPVSTAKGPQTLGSVVLTTSRQAIIAWTDDRTLSDDIYAQNLNSDGSLGLPPALISPSNNTVISTDSVRLLWNRVLPTATRYWLESGTDSLFTFASLDTTLTDTAQTLRSLANSHSYWWKVRGFDNGWGPFSAVRKFSVGTGVSGVAIGPDLPRVYALEQNFPNPFNPGTVIRYQLPAAGNVEVTVFDELGRRVATLVNQVQQPGIYHVTFDGSRLASGTYFCRMKAGAFVDTKKLLLLR